MKQVANGFAKMVMVLSLVVGVLALQNCQDSQKYALRFKNMAAGPVSFVLNGSLQAISGADSMPSAIDVQYVMHFSRVPVRTYDDGSIRFSMNADSVEYQSKQRSVEECRHIEKYLANQQVQIKMNEFGEVDDVQGVQDMPELQEVGLDMGRLLLKLQPALPGFDISVGSTWEKEHALPSPSGAPAFVYKWFRVNRVFQKNGMAHAEILVNIKYRIEGKEQQEPSIQSDQFILGSGSLVWNIVQGDIVQAALEIQGAVHILGADISEPVQVRQVLNLRRKS
jgi:hypothetical protein